MGRNKGGKSYASGNPRNFSKHPSKERMEEAGEEDHSGGEGEEEEELVIEKTISVRVSLWEFGQNDPKRDSGSKMVRFGFAKKLKVGQSFQGIVLSSEASQFLSPADRHIVEQYGVAAINCSWNRLEEIPFHAMGRSQHQRKLPLLHAANSVNYGKAFKMNTAEAIAAALFIAGFASDAMTLLYPFSFGSEFIKLNLPALEAYQTCANQEEVERVMNQFIADAAFDRDEKIARKEKEREKTLTASSKVGGYLDESDLPPMGDSDEEYEEEEYLDQEEEVQR